MHQRRRIVLLFGLGIVLPSLLLSYLAFRGIQNDRALLEKERLELIRKAADEVVRTVDAGITGVERGFEEVIADRSGSPAEEPLEDLRRFTAGHPLVEQVFRLRSSEGLHFPVADPLFVLDRSMEIGPSAAGETPRPPELLAAERREFRENDLPGALDGYLRALRRTEDPRLEAIILNAVARAQKKSGLVREAVSTYETIIRDHGAVVVAGGMPLGPSAELEICALTRDLGEHTRSLQWAVRLYRSLLGREWTLERADFELFAGRVKSHIESYLADPPAGLAHEDHRTDFQALAEEEAEARRRTERMALFQERAVPALEARLRAAPPSEPSARSFVRAALDVGSASYFVTVERPASIAAKEPESVWGLILDAEKLREDVLSPALLEGFPSGEAAWEVKGRDGTALLSSGIQIEGLPMLRAGFAFNLPDWTIEFHHPPPRLIRTFLVSRRGLYFFIFLLIAGILVFGLVLTLRSVSHELELARMKSDFVSTVSHEFKSPLTSIRQLAEMLQSGRVPSDERRRKYYDILLEQSERLSLLTDNILGLAKIEEGKTEFAFKPTDLGAFLRTVISPVRERVRHEGFAIELEIEDSLPPIAVDRTTLAQAVANLVDNAIKYSGDSRRMTVSGRTEGSGVAIAVRDFGIGINKADVPRLFERFFRAGDELTRSVKGSGLGLTLVKRIVEAHGGTVGVESEPGKGSVFTIWLPFPPREEA